MLDLLDSVLNRAKALRKALRAQKPKTVNRNDLRKEAEALGSFWHLEVAPKLRGALPEEICERYGACFKNLIRLSAPNNQVSSYLSTLEKIIKPYRSELLIPAQQGLLAAATTTTSTQDEFDQFFTGITNAEVGSYLQEAIACAKNNLFRAAVVMGWSAAVDRVHHAIDAIGFEKFNATSVSLAKQQLGRFKKFNQPQNVNSLSEMRDVPDSVLLWVMEGMELIDVNQHTRLKSCFEMRCHSAHPGDAPITKYNLLSFFSDLDQIVFANLKLTS